MFKINNLLDNENIKVVQNMGPIQILEHQLDYSSASNPYASASQLYFAHRLNIRKRQALIKLNPEIPFIIQPGSIQCTVGQVDIDTGISLKNPLDIVGKMLSAKVTNEPAIKPKYRGNGYLMLEPTYKHLLLIKVEDWGSVVLDNGLFYGCEGTVSMETIMRKNLSAMVAGGEGLFSLSLGGRGIAILESDVPFTSLAEVEIQKDELRIDGNMAIAWSGSLEFTVEKAAKGLLSTATSGEGFVNVYRGSGKVLLRVM